MMPGCQLSLGLALLLAGCLLSGSCSRPGAKPQVRIAVLASSVGQLPIYLAKSHGFFEQEGRDVKCLFLLLTSAQTLLVAAPGPAQVSTIEQLKGRTVGVTSLGSASQDYMSMLMIRHV